MHFKELFFNPHSDVVGSDRFVVCAFALAVWTCSDKLNGALHQKVVESFLTVPHVLYECRICPWYNNCRVDKLSCCEFVPWVSVSRPRPCLNAISVDIKSLCAGWSAGMTDCDLSFKCGRRSNVSEAEVRHHPGTQCPHTLSPPRLLVGNNPNWPVSGGDLRTVTSTYFSWSSQ